jgi:hypothetical protein
MAATPQEVTEIIRQLESILTHWFNSGKLGDVAAVVKEDRMYVEERPMKRHDPIRIKRTLSRAKEIATVNRDDDGQCPIGK